MNEYILPIHLGILAYAAWTIIRADHMAFRWVIGKVHVLDQQDIQKYHKQMWFALTGMILTGFLMFWPMREFLLERPQFYVKMSFVLGLMINGFAIGRLQTISTQKRFKELTVKERIPLFISGVVSTLCWIGAALGGLFLIPEY